MHFGEFDNASGPVLRPLPRKPQEILPCRAAITCSAAATPVR
jgi:hypothetical protein